MSETLARPTNKSGFSIWEKRGGRWTNAVRYLACARTYRVAIVTRRTRVALAVALFAGSVAPAQAGAEPPYRLVDGPAYVAEAEARLNAILKPFRSRSAEGPPLRFSVLHAPDPDAVAPVLAALVAEHPIVPPTKTGFRTFNAALEDAAPLCGSTPPGDYYFRMRRPGPREPAVDERRVSEYLLQAAGPADRTDQWIAILTDGSVPVLGNAYGLFFALPLSNCDSNSVRSLLAYPGEAQDIDADPQLYRTIYAEMFRTQIGPMFVSLNVNSAHDLAISAGKISEQRNDFDQRINIQLHPERK